MRRCTHKEEQKLKKTSMCTANKFATITKMQKPDSKATNFGCFPNKNVQYLEDNNL